MMMPLGHEAFACVKGLPSARAVNAEQAKLLKDVLGIEAR
jgi:hypothetical protein